MIVHFFRKVYDNRGTCIIIHAPFNSRCVTLLKQGQHFIKNYEFTEIICDWIFVWGILGSISAQNKVLSFSMPDGAGTLRLGVIENNSSRWLDENKHNCISIASHSVIQKDSFWKSKIREKILHWDGLSGDAMQSLPNQVFNLNIAKTTFLI